MTGYTAIADTSELLITLLRRELVPEVIRNANEIGLRSPGEHGDVSLGLFLYDIQICEELQQRGMIDTRMDRQAYPPVYLNLFYMITAYSGGDPKFRMVREERILGGVIQTFHNHTLIRAGEDPGGAGPDLHVQLLRLSMEEKAGIWNLQDTAYQLSLFYRVSPVAIESGRERDVSRVMETDFGVSAMGKRRR